MTEASPALSLAIPVLGPQDIGALRRTCDAIAEIWQSAPSAVRVLVQSSKGSPADFQDDLVPAGIQLDLQCAPDQGIYDAMNRMLARCSTPRIVFLGAGDCPLPGLREAASRWGHEDAGRTLQMGGVQLPKAEAGVPSHYPARWDRSLFWRNTAHHQGIAYPASLLRDHGGFTPSFQVLADYAVNLELFQKGVKAQWHPDEDWMAVQAGGRSRQFNAELYAEELRLKRAVLKPGLTWACQPVWIRFKAWGKRWAQRTE